MSYFLCFGVEYGKTGVHGNGIPGKKSNPGLGLDTEKAEFVMGEASCVMRKETRN